MLEVVIFACWKELEERTKRGNSLQVGLGFTIDSIFLRSSQWII